MTPPQNGGSNISDTTPQFTWPAEVCGPVEGLESVEVATRERERNDIFQLRYRIYIEVQGKPYPADHERRLLTDELDERGLLFYSVPHSLHFLPFRPPACSFS